MANVLSKNPGMKYHEEAIKTNFEEFKKVVQSRRSVRVYEKESIPDHIMEEILNLGLLAPNSSNLQTWKFIWVKNEDLKKQLAVACMSQQAAKTAQAMIVCVAEPRSWKRSRKMMLELFAKEPDAPKMAIDYYKKLVPLVYTPGLFSLFGWVKRIFFSVVGLFQVVPRGPFLYQELREWSVKSCALACENIMLAFRAAGYDSCPMEGYDEARVKKILGLGCGQHVVMIISGGKRAYSGVYGPQVRFDRSNFIEVR